MYTKEEEEERGREIYVEIEITFSQQPMTDELLEQQRDNRRINQIREEEKVKIMWDLWSYL